MGYAVFLALISIAIILWLAWAAKHLIFYINVPQDTALLVTGPGAKTTVHFKGAAVWPLVNQKTFVPMPYLPVKILLLSRDAPVCRDNIRAEVRATFYLKLKAKPQDVLLALETMGLYGIADTQAVSRVFKSRFAAALCRAASEQDFEQIMADRAAFCKQLATTANADLSG